jgi:1,4-dihydroxy-2-naphthoyl-CoA hydrolase
VGASIGSAIHGGVDRMTCGIEINATHHRSVAEGAVIGTATPVHLGHVLACYDVTIADSRDRRVCTARVTCLLRDR